jgi:transcriptional regulator with XRE-family HTH domain
MIHPCFFAAFSPFWRDLRILRILPRPAADVALPLHWMTRCAKFSAPEAPRFGRTAAGEQASMSVNLKDYLQAEFDRRRKKNARYSIRGFARDLKLDPTALSRILAGTRAIGAKTAKQVLSRLNLDPGTRETLLRSLIAPDDNRVPLDKDYVELAAEQVERMDDWLYSAIIELCRSKGLRLDAPSIARYFGVPIAEAEAHVGELVSLGLIRRTETGFRKTHQRSTTPLRKGSRALQRIHEGYIEKGRAALFTCDEEDRDISGITVLASREKLPEAARRIKEFRRSLAHFLSTDQGDELYRINVQLFPLGARSRRG